jgi:hypothetical protein
VARFRPVATGTMHVRWRYTTNLTAQGRGVYVDGVLVSHHRRVLFDGETRDADRFLVDGWAPSTT